MLATRVAIGVFCIVATTLLVWVEREGYNDNADGEISLLDAAYYATVTLSTTGYGDITPTSDLARLTNIFLITPLRFLFLVVLVGTALEALTKQAREERRADKWRRNLAGHTLIIGFGVKGRSAAAALLDAGVAPGRIVVIAADSEGAADATRMGLASIIGDARRKEVLADAVIGRVGQIIVATNADDTSVLVTVACSRLAPDSAQIVSAARESSNVETLRNSGDNGGVILTAEAAGRLLAMKLLSPAVGDIVEDLLDPSGGLELIERQVGSAEVSLSPKDLLRHGELVLAIIRDGRIHRFHQAAAIRVLEHHDEVVVVRQHPGTPVPGPRELAPGQRRTDSLDHTLIVGFGVKGRSAASALLDAGVAPSRIVVIAADSESAADATRMGLASMVGDARREEILQDAGIGRAGQIIVAADSDDTSVLVTLACKRLALSGAQIVSAARESSNAEILRNSGADGVIVTAEAAGQLLAMKLLFPAAGGIVEDLLDPGGGLELRQRPVTKGEKDRSPSDLAADGELVLAVLRDSVVHRFDDDETIRVLRGDDEVVVVRPTAGVVAGSAV
jgi:voltage-gated potassium channel